MIDGRVNSPILRDHWSLRHGIRLVGAHHFGQCRVVLNLVCVLDCETITERNHRLAPLSFGYGIVGVLELLQLIVQRLQHGPCDLVHAPVEPLARCICAFQTLSSVLSEHTPIPCGVNDLVGRIENNGTEIRHRRHGGLVDSCSLFYHEQRLQIRLHPRFVQIYHGYLNGRLRSDNSGRRSLRSQSTEPRDIAQSEKSNVRSEDLSGQNVYKALGKNSTNGSALRVQMLAQVLEHRLSGIHRTRPEHQVTLRDQLSRVS
mmetsp:Transcript_66550/g.177535  ORF Transcript_66550/g.177535 Transcript_66550/m.177535 type:complete len:259 (+) Transcript_66550:800-1576(+)